MIEHKIKKAEELNNEEKEKKKALNLKLKANRLHQNNQQMNRFWQSTDDQENISSQSNKIKNEMDNSRLDTVREIRDMNHTLTTNLNNM